MIESLTQVAAAQQREFDAQTSPEVRRVTGHFGTPPVIAEFMAGMFTEFRGRTVRILDPGAGVGTLSAALCDRVLGWRERTHLVFELWEIDPKLKERLHDTMEQCRRVVHDAGHAMEFTIRTDDFVLEHGRPSLFSPAEAPTFDLAVMNPPYFKVRKDDEYARVMEHVVHGQPNIYAFFMAIAADLLKTDGELVAITPRSYFNGPYFKRFRKWFFDRMTARHIHVFESRVDAFREDAVLQENVILGTVKRGEPTEVVITSSAGRDIRHVERTTLAYSKVIEDSSGDHVVRVAAGRAEQEIVAALDRLPKRFRDSPFRISTGPVVTFRSTDFLRDERSAETAPLFWMHNVRPFAIQSKSKPGKPGHVLVSEGSAKLLVRSRQYVLLKRFTAKEERRRLVAAVMEPDDSYAPVVGLENHLNYVYRADGELSRAEAFGLAAWFNSSLVDRYFRAISGNTQVNAAEIRSMPLPDVETIRRIGELVCDSPEVEVRAEEIVGRTIGVLSGLVDEYCESRR